jgi:hypothetical protein
VQKLQKLDKRLNFMIFPFVGVLLAYAPLTHSASSHWMAGGTQVCERIVSCHELTGYEGCQDQVTFRTPIKVLKTDRVGTKDPELRNASTWFNTTGAPLFVADLSPVSSRSKNAKFLAMLPHGHRLDTHYMSDARVYVSGRTRSAFKNTWGVKRYATYEFIAPNLVFRSMLNGGRMVHGTATYRVSFGGNLISSIEIPCKGSFEKNFMNSNERSL